jgi:Domain of unknown function (DUF4226)
MSQGWDGGWVAPGADFYIGRSDPYWGGVLDDARRTYGDPGIRFNTDSFDRERFLVFGDGTRLPSDGLVAYHDPGSKKNWIQNQDGSVSPAGADWRPTGDAVAPSAFRESADSYFPVGAHGQQVGPPGGAPVNANGFYTDPATGALTPKNAAGDYYTVGPDGARHFFSKAGTPITAADFDDAANPGAKPGAPGVELATDEQQSGHAAAAVKKLQEQLQENYSGISAAEERLAGVMLNAHATTAEGQQKLNDIQKEIIAAINEPANTIGTPAGQQAFLKFLRSKVEAIRDIVASGALSDTEQAQAALNNFYAADKAVGDPPPSAKAPAASAQPLPAPVDDPGPPAPVALTDPALTDPALTDVGPGPMDAMPDPSLSDVLGAGVAPFGADPYSAIASMLPGALGGLGGLGAGDPLGLGGLAGAVSPLAGLASQLGDAARPAPGADEPPQGDDAARDDPPGKSGDDADSDKAEDISAPQPTASAPAARASTAVPPPAVTPAGTPGEGAAPAAPAAAPAPTSTVSLPDGSTANAKTVPVAQAVKAYMDGAPVDAAYRQFGMELPPPGTPVTDPAPPSQISSGYLGMFKDHYVVAASSVKAFQAGEIVPLSSVSSSPDFLGWIDPSKLSAAAAPAPQTAAEPPVLTGPGK